MLWLFLSWGRCVAAGQTPAQRLDAAVNAYEHGGYLEAAAELTSLLYPLKLDSREQIVRAKLYLGMSYYVLERRDEAAQEFRDIYRIDPDWTPDPLWIPPEIIDFIEANRPENVVRPIEVPGLGEQLNDESFRPVVWQPQNLIPFGVAHFRHGDLRRGLSLAIGESALLSLNVATYWYLAINNTANNTPELARKLSIAKTVNWTSFSLWALVTAFGIGDAVYRYRDAPQAPSAFLWAEPGGGGLAFQVRF